MAIPIVAGIRLYGRINEDDRTWIATRFFHLQGLPVVPLGTVRGAHGSDDPYEKAKLSVASMLLGWFNTWGFVVGVLLMLVFGRITSATDWAELSHDPPMFATALVVSAGVPLVLVLSVVACWFWIGRRPGWSNGKRTAVMLATMAVCTAPLALLLGDRVQEGLEIVRLERERAAAAKEALLAAQKAQRETDDRARAILRSALEAHGALRPDALPQCQGPVASAEGAVLAASTIEVQALKAGLGETSGAHTHDWLSSDDLRMPASAPRFEHAQLASVGKQLLVVFHVASKPQSGPSFLSLHDGTGRTLCGTKISPPFLPHATRAERQAFVDAARKALARIAPRVEIRVSSLAS